MTGLLLDTHIWIWLSTNDSQLPLKFRQQIEQAIRSGASLNLSSISQWELAMLEAKGRIILEMPCLEWIRLSIDSLGCNLVPLSAEIAVESTNLPGEIHLDPADRIIVASARVAALTLVTKDKKLIQYGKAGHVSVMTA